MRRELSIFLACLSFYTRIPVAIAGGKAADLAQSIKYFPLIGWLAGALSALVFIGSNIVFGQNLAIVFSMLSTILLTGALHEDGLADVCDGFGGGWIREKILEIMKDSRIGTYGVISLVFVTAIKFLTIQQLIAGMNFPSQWPLLTLLFILAHTLSRFNASTMIFTHNYVRADESKSGAMVLNAKLSNLYVALVFTLIPLIILVFYTQQYKWIFILVPLTFVKLFLNRYFDKWIGGYTGDCLGAIQQTSEVVIYLSVIVLWKFF
ncbi:MAG: adenosylcobinamide-GDP ribazoletransferase [Bacteroidota bacterium]